MPVLYLKVSIDTGDDRTENKMRKRSAEFRAYALEGIILTIYKGITTADARQEPGDAFGERSLGVLSKEYRDGSITIDNLEGSMKEFSRMDGPGSKPMLLLPEAHSVRIGRAPLAARTDKVMNRVVLVLLSELCAKAVRGLLGLYEGSRQVGVHLAEVSLILGEFSRVVKEALNDHEELKLLVKRVGDEVIGALREGRRRYVYEAYSPNAPRLRRVERRDDLFRSSRDGRIYDDRPSADPGVTPGYVFRRILREDGYGTVHGRIGSRLKARGPGSAYAHKHDGVEALATNRINDTLYLRPKGQGAGNIFKLRLLIKFNHTTLLVAYMINIFTYQFVYRIVTPPLF